MQEKLENINCCFFTNIFLQVNANQMRLESMVAMASDKAGHMRKEVETRSMEDRRLFNLELRNQSEKVVTALQKLSFRLDEMDGMYDDMQERLYEVDKSRKNNLVFYGVPQQTSDEDPDETERLIKSVITVKLQVRTVPHLDFTKKIKSVRARARTQTDISGNGSQRDIKYKQLFEHTMLRFFREIEWS